MHIRNLATSHLEIINRTVLTQLKINNSTALVESDTEY